MSSLQSVHAQSFWLSFVPSFSHRDVHLTEHGVFPCQCVLYLKHPNPITGGLPQTFLETQDKFSSLLTRHRCSVSAPGNRAMLGTSWWHWGIIHPAKHSTVPNQCATYARYLCEIIQGLPGTSWWYRGSLPAWQVVTSKFPEPDPTTSQQHNVIN